MPTVPLIFPAGGLMRSTARQRQPPYWTPDCLNARPYDPIEGRERGGPRPGMEQYSRFAKFGSDQQINMISCVTVSGEAGVEAQTFVQDLRQEFGQPTWKLSPNTDVIPGFGWTLDDPTSVQGSGFARMQNPLSIDRNREYTVALTSRAIADPVSRFDMHNSVVRIDLGLDGQEHPATGRWVQVELRSTFDRPGDLGVFTQTFLLTVRNMLGLNPVQDVFSHIIIGQNASPGNVTLSATIDGDFLTVRLVTTQSSSVYGFTSDPVVLGGFSGNILGMYMGRVFLGGAIIEPYPVLLTEFAVNYFSVAPSAFPNADCLLAVAANGRLIFSKGADAGGGPFVSPAEKLDQKTRPLMAVDAIVPPSADGDLPVRSAGPKLFIADYDPGSSSIEPKYYDPATNELHPWKVDPRGTTGAVPLGNHILAKFQRRLYLAGNPPHAFQASAIEDPFDWHFDPDDPTTALVENVGDGSIGEPIRAMAPFTEDYMLIFSANRTLRMTGDLRFGGQIVTISTQVGCVGPFAWTATPDGSMVWLDGERGLFQLVPGLNSFPVAISDERLPRELKSIDPKTTNATVVYDHLGVGIHIILHSANAIDSWWFDWRKRGFWPDRFHFDRQPLIAFDYQSTNPRDSGLLLGGSDGTLRRFSELETDDDGKQFFTHIVYGPFLLAGADHLEGSIEWVRCTVTPLRTRLIFQVFTASNAQEGLLGPRRRNFGSVFNPITSGAPTNIDAHLEMRRHRVGLRGVVGYVRLETFPGQQWAVETLDINVRRQARALV